MQAPQKKLKVESYVVSFNSEKQRLKILKDNGVLAALNRQIHDYLEGTDKELRMKFNLWCLKSYCETGEKAWSSNVESSIFVSTGENGISDGNDIAYDTHEYNWLDVKISEFGLKKSNTFTVFIKLKKGK